MSETKYVSKDTAYLYLNNGDKVSLLWGDTVITVPSNKKDGKIKAEARGYYGYISPDDIGDESLLEIYVIDVGQGDGILIKCPEGNKETSGNHIMIDGGYMREKQPTQKNAADFIDWKFKKEYKSDTITIDDMIVSHCDADHYGGLWDLINEDPSVRSEIDCNNVDVKRLYHAGVGWWRLKKGGSRTVGEQSGGKIKRVLTNKTDVKRYLKNARDEKYPQLQGEYGDFFSDFVKYQKNASIKFLGYEAGSNKNAYLPKYEPENSDVTLKVLGPLYYDDNGKLEMNDLGNSSKNTNGNSIVLSMKYGCFKMLLTGDLNKKSQIKLSEEHPPGEFASDVAKACHHGSHDISFSFLQKVHAAATVISSGDNEKHAHPKANLLSMSALSGYLENGNDTIKSPLIFSTEIARSIRIGIPISGKANIPSDNNPANDISIPNINDLKLTYRRGDAGDLRKEEKTKKLNRLTLIDGIVYGLVNIRTDGKKILFGIRKEKGKGWETDVLYSRFERTV